MSLLYPYQCRAPITSLSSQQILVLKEKIEWQVFLSVSHLGTLDLQLYLGEVQIFGPTCDFKREQFSLCKDYYCLTIRIISDIHLACVCD